MNEKTPEPMDKETMPFVAPCRQLKFLAPFGWLRRGMLDLGKAPQQGLTYASGQRQ